MEKIENSAFCIIGGKGVWRNFEEEMKNTSY